MKALVYHGPGARAWEEVPDPGIAAPTDIVIRVDAVTICGTDLHILKGDVPEVEPGTILGHEAVGTVVETGDAVTTLRKGDRVLASCITSCGRCPSCREGRYGLCTGGGGWILGHLIDGVQAEYARIPFADTSAYRIPAGLDSDEQVLFLADILPTSYEVGILAGQLRPGDTVAIVGAGPIGLAAVLTANLYTPRAVIVLDPDQSRLDRALACGATDAVIETGDAARERVLSLTGGLGVDLAIEAVGVPDTFELCTDIVRAGGHVANVGVHGKPATLHLERLWIKDVTITTGLVDTCTTPRLMQLIEAGKLDPAVFTTHRFSLDDAMDAYDAFADATTSGAFKVVLEGEKHLQLVPAEAALVGARDDDDCPLTPSTSSSGTVARFGCDRPGGRTPRRCSSSSGPSPSRASTSGFTASPRWSRDSSSRSSIPTGSSGAHSWGRSPTTTAASRWSPSRTTCGFATRSRRRRRSRSPTSISGAASARACSSGSRSAPPRSESSDSSRR